MMLFSMLFMFGDGVICISSCLVGLRIDGSMVEKNVDIRLRREL